MKNKMAFGWYGGKYSHLKWLLPLLPDTQYYCEPFGGSAAVLINRKPAKVETYNDLNSEVVNFFRMLRECPDELIRLLTLTPFSKEELRLSRIYDGISDLERARRFYVRARQSRSALVTTSHDSWAHCRTAVVGGMSSAVARYINGLPQLVEVADRFRRVQIEQDNALTLIPKYDDPDTLFYCDPPYPHDSRLKPSGYTHEMSNEDHEALADCLHTARGKVAISGYESATMGRLYGDWTLIKGPAKQTRTSFVVAQECLWVNYSIGA